MKMLYLTLDRFFLWCSRAAKELFPQEEHENVLAKQDASKTEASK